MSGSRASDAPHIRYHGIIVTRMPGGEDRNSTRAIRLVVRGFLTYGGRETVALRVSVRLQGGSSRQEKRLEAVGLAIGGEPYVRLVADVWLPPGDYEVTTPVLPDVTFRFQILPEHSFPISLCRHETKRPSAFQTRYLFSSSGVLTAAEQVITSQKCCAATPHSGVNAYWLNVTQALGSPVVMTDKESHVWIIRPGDYFITNPESDHWMAPRQKFPISLRRVIVSQSIIRSLRTELGLPKSLGPLGFAEGPRRITPGIGRALALFETIELDDQETFMALATRMLVLSLLQDHPNALKGRRSIESPYPEEDASLSAVIRLFRARYQEPLEIDQVAKEVGVSPAWLRRRFRTVVRQSPKDYLKALRLDQAVRLLKEGRHSVADISRLVGYRDVRSFYRVFQGYTGTHPTAVRPPSVPQRVRK